MCAAALLLPQERASPFSLLMFPPNRLLKPQPPPPTPMRSRRYQPPTGPPAIAPRLRQGEAGGPRALDALHRECDRQGGEHMTDRPESRADPGGRLPKPPDVQEPSLSAAPPSPSGRASVSDGSRGPSRVCAQEDRDLLACVDVRHARWHSLPWMQQVALHAAARTGPQALGTSISKAPRLQHLQARWQVHSPNRPAHDGPLRVHRHPVFGLFLGPAKRRRTRMPSNASPCENLLHPVPRFAMP